MKISIYCFLVLTLIDRISSGEKNFQCLSEFNICILLIGNFNYKHFTGKYSPMYKCNTYILILFIIVAK